MYFQLIETSDVLFYSTLISSKELCMMRNVFQYQMRVSVVLEKTNF